MSKVVMSMGEEYVGLTWEEAKRVIHAMDFYLDEMEFPGDLPESYYQIQDLQNRIKVCKTILEGGPELPKVESRMIRLNLCETQYRKTHEAYHIISTWSTLDGDHAGEFYIKGLSASEVANFVKFLAEDMSKVVQYFGTRYNLQNDFSVPLYLRAQRHESGTGYEMNVYWTPKGSSERHCVSYYGMNLLVVRDWLRRVIVGKDLTNFLGPMV